ncbi:MAG: hypothetical protein GQ565_10880 [Candidatus Aegiribacteria sp.]|nr:hypothetical protein [Candidatus Aegiribacteria sp.]
MKFNFLFSIAVILSLLAQQLVMSCAVNRVIYNEKMEMDGVLVRVVLLESREMHELVISMQEPGHFVKERVFLVNWIPHLVEVDDYNGDSRLDIKILSTGDEAHYFYSTELGFVDI